MKHSLFVFVLSVILFSCKKEITLESQSHALLTDIKFQLKDSMPADDFQQLDFDRSFISKYEKGNLTMIRIPFINKNIATEFLLLKIEKNGAISIGKKINIIGNQYQRSSRSGKLFNGKIMMYSLKGDLITESLITGGYIEAFHKTKNSTLAKEDVVEVPLLPEVVLVSSYSTGSWAGSSLYNLQGIMYSGTTSGGGGSGGYYNVSDPMSTSGSYSTVSGGGYTNPSVLIDYEPVENLPAIDLVKYLKCFGNIPDVGATCTIKIVTDIPVDSDPYAFFNWDNNSPGHTFLQITKSNGSNSIQQNIGFYPTVNWKNVLTTAPMDGKLVDNAGHEFNASLTMNLTPDKFQSTLVHMQYLANFIRYDIDDYNCTDFALDVFNYRRGGSQLVIPKFNIPGGAAPDGTNTPQGLYLQLKAMQVPGSIDSKNITIPGVKGFAGNSNGPCN